MSLEGPSAILIRGVRQLRGRLLSCRLLNGPEPTSVIGVSFFVIAPPFRRHGIASALLDRVIVDASSRGAAWIEAYPDNKPEESDAGHFRGPRSMYDARGFEPIKVRERDTVVRLSAGKIGC